MQAGLGVLLPAGVGLEVLVLLFPPSAPPKKNAVLKWAAPMFCVQCPLLTLGGGLQSPRGSRGAGASGLP